MTERKTPPFHAEHIGSLLRPAKLREAREAWTAGRLEKAELKKLEDECIRTAVAMQVKLGLPSISDGEFRREHWMENFHRAVDGYTSKEKVEGSFRFTTDDGKIEGTRPVPKLTAKLSRRDWLVADEWAFTKSLNPRGVVKATMPSPSMVHLGAGDAQIDKRVYPDRDQFMVDVSAIYREEIAELAKRGCTYVQLDECALPVLCDPNNRERVKQRGESPEANADFYVKAINDAVRDRPAGMTVCIHMCRGNRGQGMASGGYEWIAERALARLNVDGFLLEYDSPRAGDFSPLSSIPKGRYAILGMVSTKKKEPEPVDELKRRVEEASRYIDLQQLGVCPQCGFASSYTTDRLSETEQERKLARVLETAHAIWG